MKTKKAKVLSVVLVTAVVAAGLLAAVAMAWPQTQPRALQEERPQQRPAQVQQPAEVLPGGGATQAALNFAE